MKAASWRENIESINGVWRNGIGVAGENGENMALRRKPAK